MAEVYFWITNSLYSWIIQYHLRIMEFVHQLYLRATYTADRSNNSQALRKPWKYKIIPFKNFFLFREKISWGSILSLAFQWCFLYTNGFQLTSPHWYSIVSNGLRLVHNVTAFHCTASCSLSLWYREAASEAAVTLWKIIKLLPTFALLKHLCLILPTLPVQSLSRELHKCRG